MGKAEKIAADKNMLGSTWPSLSVLIQLSNVSDVTPLAFLILRHHPVYSFTLHMTGNIRPYVRAFGVKIAQVLSLTLNRAEGA